MSRTERRLAQARQVAAFLDDIGEPKYANDVRDVCRSLDAARHALSQLHRDNMELRGNQC